jgi:hypothetical protein
LASGRVEAFELRGIMMQSIAGAERDVAWRLFARRREIHRK